MHLMVATRPGTCSSREYHITMYICCDRQQIIIFFNYTLHNEMYKAKFIYVYLYQLIITLYLT